MTAAGVSFIVPVRNGAPWIRDVMRAILSQQYDGPIEVIAVDDGSTDDSASILRDCAADRRVRVAAGRGGGAAQAINIGIREATHPLIAQIDQDVILEPGWLTSLVRDLDDRSVGASQGYYVAAPDAGLCARIMNLDLEQRWAAISGAETGHVCTGNVLYRQAALMEIGLFDESLGYGYDNDVSYRLRAAGYRLTLNRSARSVHRWREGFVDYVRQQYGFGYGRIDLIAKHPSRATGDSVSRLPMMAHPIVMASALGLGASGALRLSAVLVGLLAGERFAAGLAAARRFDDRRALWFPVFHIARDLAWVTAMAVWLGRRFVQKPARPDHSMTPRAAGYAVNRPASVPAPKRPRA